ncbi:hypothetical protein SSP35_06_02400 [Streptomyces sp. NBRC 110611]|uniref:hypothetical protein n=1 Tax=Streptomyces sp. NBRC 110611 TaxID=1621259 RepID=UPI00082D585C|nr:hypothetical protein [Streptomyces sp. NBRC 110611]GAU68152.1 hypothetical protein SSP35_06_02400 [Streptomyces sp. NBRC 110611]
MRRITTLFGSLGAAASRDTAVGVASAPASGFLTIGGTTYIDPGGGSYPIDHSVDGCATLIVNDTDRLITIITERNHHPPSSGPGHAPPPAIVLAPGERTETWTGDSVQVG